MSLGLSPIPSPSLAETSPAARRPTKTSPKQSEYFVELVTPDQLAARSAAWNDLARQAIEPNPFQEPWMLLEAIRAFGQNLNLKCVLVYWYSGRPQDPREPLLCGLFVLEEHRRQRRLPVKTWSLWKHEYAFLGTPLIRHQHAVPVLNTLFDWVRTLPNGPALLDWQLVHGEGPFQQALIDATRQCRLTVHAVDQYNRALLVPASDAETYSADAMTCHNRQELRRQRRRLAEHGDLDFRVLSSPSELEFWIDTFLELEGCGWKGQEQTALRENPTHREYFRNIARAAFERGQLMLLGLFLDERPIAVKCNFRAGHGAFAFKIGFDETLARFSPGVQLELENIQLAHRIEGLQWMDSCAAPVHFMINRLWSERRTVQKLLISTGRRSGELLLGVLPLWRALKRCCRNDAPTISKPPSPQETKS